MAAAALKRTQERKANTSNGGLMLLAALVVALACSIWALIESIRYENGGARRLLIGALRSCFVLAALAASIRCSPTRPPRSPCSATTRAPTARPACAGCCPGTRARRSRLRVRNVTGEKLKVNDKRGNPIEIAAVVVWRVTDTARALFDVDHLPALRRHPDRDRRARDRLALCLRPRRARRAHAARRRRSGVGAAARKAAGARRRRRRRDRRNQAHPPRLRAGNRRRHAAPPAGRSRARRAPLHRARRGGDGAARAGATCPNATSSSSTTNAARRWCRTCWSCSAATATPSRSSTPARSTSRREPWPPIRKPSRSASIPRSTRRRAPGQRGSAQRERGDRVPAARSAERARRAGRDPSRERQRERPSLTVIPDAPQARSGTGQVAPTRRICSARPG